MAIKGLTDRAARFPQLGTIRKGAPRPASGKAPGRDLDYFRLDTHDPDLEQQFGQIYGDQPRVLPGTFPHHETEQNFPCWMEEWTQSSLKRRCDGEEQILWLDGIKYSRTAKPCETGSCSCKQIGRLQVVLPALKRLGYFELQTHSKWDILGINESLEAVYQALGTLRGVPFLISRRQREISVPMGDKRVRTEKWLLHVEIEPKWSQKTMEALETRAIKHLGGVASQDFSTDIEASSTVELKALPSTQEDFVPAYRAWQSEDDALLWARQELGWNEAQVRELLDSTPPSHGKKGLAFYHAVKERQQAIEF